MRDLTGYPLSEPERAWAQCIPAHVRTKWGRTHGHTACCLPLRGGWAELPAPQLSNTMRDDVFVPVVMSFVFQRAQDGASFAGLTTTGIRFRGKRVQIARP